MCICSMFLYSKIWLLMYDNRDFKIFLKHWLTHWFFSWARMIFFCVADKIMFSLFYLSEHNLNRKHFLLWSAASELIKLIFSVFPLHFLSKILFITFSIKQKTLFFQSSFNKSFVFNAKSLLNTCDAEDWN